MPLSAAVLSADIKARLLANCGAVDDAPLTDFCDEIADAVVSHITANAVVAVTVNTVTACGAGAGTGSGGGNGTIS